MAKVKVTGGCACGGVRWTAEVESPAELIWCHCKLCRVFHGVTMPFVSLKVDDMTWDSDSTLAWYPTEQGNRRGGCKTCGAALFFQDAGGPTIEAAAGCFDARLETAPRSHIWFGNRPPWLTTPPGVLRFERGDVGPNAGPPLHSSETSEPEAPLPGPARISGGCQCGAVRFAASLPRPANATWCHCSLCRRFHGDSTLFAHLPKDRLEWEADSGMRWWKTEQGNRRGGCRECGSMLAYEAAGAPSFSAAAGCLDADSERRIIPRSHLFHADRGAWHVDPDDGLPRWDGYPDGGFEPLADPGGHAS